MTLHDDPHHDAMLLLVKARANVGVPVKDKAIRKLDITELRARAARPAAKTRYLLPTLGVLTSAVTHIPLPGPT